MRVVSHRGVANPGLNRVAGGAVGQTPCDNHTFGQLQIHRHRLVASAVVNTPVGYQIGPIAAATRGGQPVCRRLLGAFEPVSSLLIGDGRDAGPELRRHTDSRQRRPGVDITHDARDGSPGLAKMLELGRDLGHTAKPRGMVCRV